MTADKVMKPWVSGTAALFDFLLGNFFLPLATNKQLYPRPTHLRTHQVPSVSRLKTVDRLQLHASRSTVTIF